MHEVRLTQAADADIEAIAEYTIQRFGVRQARIYRDGLWNTFDILAEFPELGARQEHVGPSVRRFVHESHSIYYELGESEILILRILGRGQDPQRHFS